jgi:Fe-Mn family superoxide dismutase
MAFEVKEHLKPTGLVGISADQIDQHWGLYKGYVVQTNALEAELDALRKDGKEGSAAYTDRRRRYGFEYNGMILHEWYFGNLKSGGSEMGSALKAALESRWGSVDAWKADFMNTGKSRSIGWAILYMDPETKSLSNHFIQLHEEGNPATFMPILVMDVWEHAYMVDFGAAGRPKYIDQFFANVDFAKASTRFSEVNSGKIPVRG